MAKYYKVRHLSNDRPHLAAADGLSVLVKNIRYFFLIVVFLCVRAIARIIMRGLEPSGCGGGVVVHKTD